MVFRPVTSNRLKAWEGCGYTSKSLATNSGRCKRHVDRGRLHHHERADKGSFGATDDFRGGILTTVHGSSSLSAVGVHECSVPKFYSRRNILAPAAWLRG